MTAKAIDSWWTVLFVDPYATRIAPRLARIEAVTPIRITALAHLLGVVSAVLFATDHLLAGAIVFECRFATDCMDGKVARATGRTSVLGRELDALGDLVLVSANLGALALARADSPAGYVVATVLVGVYLASFHLHEVRARLLAEAGRPAFVEDVVRTSYGAFMAERRLYPMPSSVDLEHLALVIGPLLLAVGIDVVDATLICAAGFFALQALRYLVAGLRIASTLDRGPV